MHGNTESNVESTAEWTPSLFFPLTFLCVVPAILTPGTGWYKARKDFGHTT